MTASASTCTVSTHEKVQSDSRKAVENPDSFSVWKRAVTTVLAFRAAVTGAAAELQRLSAERDELVRENAELAARLAEIEAQEPVAWVPIHPRTGPLWSMTTGSPDPERLPHYPLMPLYTCPAPDWKTAERDAALAELAGEAG